MPQLKPRTPLGLASLQALGLRRGGEYQQFGWIAGKNCGTRRGRLGAIDCLGRRPYHGPNCGRGAARAKLLGVLVGPLHRTPRWHRRLVCTCWPATGTRQSRGRHACGTLHRTPGWHGQLVCPGWCATGRQATSGSRRGAGRRRCHRRCRYARLLHPLEQSNRLASTLGAGIRLRRPAQLVTAVRAAKIMIHVQIRRVGPCPLSPAAYFTDTAAFV